MARRTSRWAAPTYGVAGLVFAGALGGLAVQVSAGEDPALGAPVAQAAIPQPHYVVTRRVERRRVVVRRVRDLPPLPAPAAGPSGVTAYPTGAGTTVAVPSAPASGAPSAAPSTAASAPAPAPAAAAPAPAASVPAPVTRAS